MSTYEQEVSEQAKLAEQKAKIMSQAQNRVQAMIDAGEIAAAPDNSGRKVRAYVAPVERNTRYLVKAGEPVAIRDPNSPTGERLTQRKGDIFVDFVDGICVLDDSDPDFVLKADWCDAHSALCRDITDPFTEAWAYMTELKHETSSQSARLPKDINIEKILRGDPSGNVVPHSTVERARERAESLKG